MQSHRALLERSGTSFDGAIESYRNATGLIGLSSTRLPLTARDAGGSQGPQALLVSQ